MTEEEISRRIRRWEIYAEVGNPYEHDYGKPTPREYGLSSAERGYVPRSRNQWMTPDEILQEQIDSKPTRAEYEMVERIYQTRSVRDRMTIAYFGACPPVKIPEPHVTVVLLFRGDVSRA